jgi:hypothetical protein
MKTCFGRFSSLRILSKMAPPQRTLAPRRSFGLLAALLLLVFLSRSAAWGDEPTTTTTAATVATNDSTETSADHAETPLAIPNALSDPNSLLELDEAARAWLSEPGAEVFGRWLSDTLEDRPDTPEWLAMLADILQGSQLGPNDGWFRRAVAQTRYGWKESLDRWDGNGDGHISSDEFPGDAADFRRLDRNGNGVLDEEDFDWSSHALSYNPGMVLYYMLDRDGNGKVTRDECLAWFDAMDREQRGFLSQEELRELFAQMERGGNRNAAPNEGPSKATLIKGLFQQEIGSLQPGPDLETRAPDFTLRTAAGDGEITLSQLVGEKPVVLIFGNITCGPFRGRAGDVEKLYQRYRDRAHFLMIYVREAHPTDGWHMGSNDRVQITLAQPTDDAQRFAVARTCQRLLDFEMPFLVDSIDDHVGATYSGMPSRLYVLDEEGRVAYKSGRGPFGFKPSEMEQSLLLLLAAMEGSRDDE